MQNNTEDANKWFNNLEDCIKQSIVTWVYNLSLMTNNDKNIIEQFNTQLQKKDENHFSQIKLKNEEIDKLKDDYNLKIQLKEIKIQQLEKENDSISHNVGFKMIEESLGKKIMSLENKIIEKNNKLEQTVSEKNNKLEQTIVNSNNNLEKNILSKQNLLETKLTSNHSKGVIGENWIENILSNIPGCITENVTRDLGFTDFYVKINEINILIESKNAEKIKPEYIEKFKDDVLKDNINIDIGIFVAQRVPRIYGSNFHLEIVNKKDKIVFLFYIADTFNHPERLSHAINIGKVLVENNHTTNDIQHTISMVTNIYKQIEALEKNSSEFYRQSCDFQILVKKNKEQIDELFNTFKLIMKKDTKYGTESENNWRQLCIDIVKRFIILDRKFSIQDIVGKAVSLGVKKSRAETIIAKELKGLKRIKEIAEESLKENNSSPVLFE